MNGGFHWRETWRTASEAVRDQDNGTGVKPHGARELLNSSGHSLVLLLGLLTALQSLAPVKGPGCLPLWHIALGLG
jgi:hypothetical protein